MNPKTNGFRTRNISLVLLVTIVIVSLSGITNLLIALGSSPLSVAGFLDHSYGAAPAGPPTGEKPESKLWWNDGFWWGSMFNPQDNKYHIYRLNWGDQNWEDTGVVLDDRPTSRNDALWDASNHKLYIASHVFSKISAKEANNTSVWARLYRFSYDNATQKYTLDNGYPVNVNSDKTETLVLDKDSTGRLWVTYVSRIPPSNDAQVYINTTTAANNDSSWGTPISLGSLFPEAHVTTDDISSIIAFQNKIGVMWSNQLPENNKFYFAVHADSSAPGDGWNTPEVIQHGAYNANDHLNLAKDNSGNIFVAAKTEISPGIVLLARDTSGTWSYHELSSADSLDTRPIVIVNSDENKLYVFNTSSEGGGIICYREIPIVTPLSDITYTPNNCLYRITPHPGDPAMFIADTTTYTKINNSTSFKQMANNITGLVVLASDDINGQVYVHNVLGNPPPVVTNRLPDFNATNISKNTTITATFSKAMDETTLNASTFTVTGPGGAVAGALSFNATTRTVTFTPSAPLAFQAEYTVTLTSGVHSSDGQALFGASEIWKFTTEPSGIALNNHLFLPLINK